jgi:hypothetical protein
VYLFNLLLTVSSLTKVTEISWYQVKTINFSQLKEIRLRRLNRLSKTNLSVNFDIGQFFDDNFLRRFGSERDAAESLRLTVDSVFEEFDFLEVGDAGIGNRARDVGVRRPPRKQFKKYISLFKTILFTS